MSIPETYHFDNSGEVVRYPGLRRYFVAASIVLLTVLAFGIGRLTAGRGEGRGVSINMPSTPASQPSAPEPASGSVYASSQGTRYYYPSCKSTIVDKNKVTFATAALAEAAGYTLASGCVKP